MTLANSKLATITSCFNPINKSFFVNDEVLLLCDKVNGSEVEYVTYRLMGDRISFFICKKKQNKKKQKKQKKQKKIYIMVVRLSILNIFLDDQKLLKLIFSLQPTIKQWLHCR